MGNQLIGDPQTERIPLILCTGAIRVVETIKPELDSLGVAVVYKPFDIEEVVLTAREALGLTSGPEESLMPPLD